MKKYELKMLLEASKAENEMLEEHIKELREVIDNKNNMRITKDREIQKLQNHIKELETTIRVLQNI